MIIDSPEKNGLIIGARLTWASVSTATIGTAAEDSCVRDSTNMRFISFNGTIAVDIAVSGKGGLDTGSESSSTWYCVFIIDDSTGTNAPDSLLSVSATAPTMPTGYDVFRRVGWLRNNASSNFLKVIQVGSGRDRWHHWDELLLTLSILNFGQSAGAWTAVSAASLIPPTSQWGKFGIVFQNTGQSALNTGNIRPTGSTLVAPSSTAMLISPGIILVKSLSNQFQCPTDSNQSIDYMTSQTGNKLSISVQGFLDEL